MIEDAEAFLLQQLTMLGNGLHAALTGQELPRSQELCPVEDGHLRGTGKVSAPVIDGTVVSCTISYGDPGVERTAISAIMQHERHDYAHPNGGQAKYLETAVVEGQPSLLSRIKANAR